MSNKQKAFDCDKLRTEYETNGYAIVESYFTDDEIDEIRYEIEQIITNFNPNKHPQNAFVTTDEKKLYIK